MLVTVCFSTSLSMLLQWATWFNEHQREQEVIDADFGNGLVWEERPDLK